MNLSVVFLERFGTLWLTIQHGELHHGATPQLKATRIVRRLRDAA
jgi:hypothetical protein